MVVRTPRLWCIGIAALLAAAAGCSSDSGDDDGDDASGDAPGDDGDGADDDGVSDGSDGSGDDGMGPGPAFTIDWGPVMIEPGMEDTRCVTKELPVDRPIRIGQLVNELGLASHHMIVYRLADGETNDEPVPCDPFVDVLNPEAGAPLAVTQRPEETISLPPGVAFTLGERQLIRIELHFINATEEPRELRASSTFIELPEAEFEQEADFLFIGNPDIELPAAPNPPEEPPTITLGPSYLPMPNELAGVQIFAITGHEHQWGTNVQVSLATDEDDEGTSIYAPENFQWDEPETVYHDPPIEVPAGAGFRFSCEWQNHSREPVGFGESVDDEMCFFWAYYYPSKGAKICFHTDQFGDGIDLCCPGSSLCEFVPGFLD